MIIPQGADNYEHATMCEKAGTAIALRPETLTATSLATAVQRVVNADAFTVASRRCAAELLAMPDATSIAMELRSWVPGN